RRQQVGLLVLLVAGHQRQIGIVVARQDVFLKAAGGLVLQREELHTLVGALSPLALLGDALGEVSARIRRPRLNRGQLRSCRLLRRRRGRRRRRRRSRSGCRGRRGGLARRVLRVGPWLRGNGRSTG